MRRRSPLRADRPGHALRRRKKYRRASLRDLFALRKPRPPFIHCSGLRELNNLWSIVTLGLETERAEPQPDGGINPEKSQPLVDR